MANILCRLICLTSLSAQLAAAVLETCLPNAIPTSARKDLAGPDGSYPIGVWVNGWPAGFVTAAVVHILLEERIGFNVEETGPGPSTVDACFCNVNSGLLVNQLYFELDSKSHPETGWFRIWHLH